MLEGACALTLDTGESLPLNCGDLVLLPMKPGGVVHQHFNLQPDKGPAKWVAFINLPIHEHVASDLRQVENSPEFTEG